MYKKSDQNSVKKQQIRKLYIVQVQQIICILIKTFQYKKCNSIR